MALSIEISKSKFRQCQLRAILPNLMLTIYRYLMQKFSGQCHCCGIAYPHSQYELVYSICKTHIICFQANRRYPHQLNLPLHYQCVLDEDGGVLLASKCLAAFQVSAIDLNIHNILP